MQLTVQLTTKTHGNLILETGDTIPCVIGKNGVIDAHLKQEGDNCTPKGTWRMLELYYRDDRLTCPQTQLTATKIEQGMIWDDTPASPTYNTRITGTLPHPESLWREDEAYNIIIPLSYNTNPAIPHKGSAIFFHIMKENYKPTAGCIAIAQEDMLKLIPHLTSQSTITV